MFWRVVAIFVWDLWSVSAGMKRRMRMILQEEVVQVKVFELADRLERQGWEDMLRRDVL